jgi:ComF family protein
MMQACKRALSWIFGPQCAACGEGVDSGLPFCAGCAPSLEENLVCCPRCAEPLAGARAATCARCASRPLPLARIAAPWQYGGALADALVRFKFGGHPEIARALAPLFAPMLVATASAEETTVIAPVPLHWTRRLRRGFDQTQLLLGHALALHPSAAELGSVLRRVRATEYQSRTDSARGRVRNLAGAMEVTPRWRRRVVGARVLLFDDVVTTGATMAAAARALRRAGAAHVVGVALARGGTRL